MNKSQSACYPCIRIKMMFILWSTQSCLFVQSLPGNFLVQCRENLWNVGATFAGAGYYQKINQLKIKIAENWCYSEDIGFYSVQCCLESLGQHCTEFLLVQCCPKSITTLLNRSFSYEMFSEGSWTTLHKAFTCAMLSQDYYDNIEQDLFLGNVF